MENINIEEYIKDLSPELQEKARACKSIDELVKLAGENKVPIPDEALEAVAGGGLKGPDKPTDTCPKDPGHGHHRIHFTRNWRFCNYYNCYICGQEFIYLENEPQPEVD